MKKKQKPQTPLIFMKHLNLLIIIYIGVVTWLSIRGIVARHDAITLISYAGTLPFEAWKTLVLGVGYYICLLILLSYNSVDSRALSIKIICEIVVAVSICNALHFGYPGIFLLIMADSMQYVQDLWRRFSVLVVLGIGYLLMDEQLVVMLFPIVPLKTMWMFFPSRMSALLFLGLNFLTVVNLFAFIIFMVALMLDQMSERKRIFKLYQELEAKNEQLIAYADEMEMATQTKERNRLAREIHDTLGHSLTGIITGIDACVMLMDVAPEATKLQLKAIADVARQGIKDVRRSINALRPDALERIDLKLAMEKMVGEMADSTGVKIEFLCETDLKGYTQDEEDTIYRIVQESITNAIRHGKATHIYVTIRKQLHILSIDIKDNGIGCKDIKKGFGLHHMQERLGMLNGHLTYDGLDGFHLFATIPIRRSGESNND